MSILTPDSLRTVLELKGSLKLKVASDSMSPVIKVNELIVLEPLKNLGNLKRFDIIVYAKNDSLICHYFWTPNSFQKETICTRSLKEPYYNELPVPVGSILGVVTSHRVNPIRRSFLILMNLLRASL